MKTIAPASQTPFTDLMLHPEKLAAALKIARRENDAFEAARTVTRSPGNRAAPDAPSQGNGARKSTSHLRAEFKGTEFYLKAIFAKSVRLVADFTDWEKFPLDMVKSEDGDWAIFVPLPPGNYSYRFIVDGEWSDDPQADLHEANPFGTFNAVVKVS
jgi:hypothetical protein